MVISDDGNNKNMLSICMVQVVLHELTIPVKTILTFCSFQHGDISR